jgi:hypothetical protein
METNISVKKIRGLFFTKSGLPKKEYLKNAYEILEEIEIETQEMSKEQRAYILNIVNACLSAIRKVCREHHINFVDVKDPEERYVKHGFTQDVDKIKNHLVRIEGRKKAHQIIYNKVKAIIYEQLQLDFGE